jgi:hypothetical protein
MKKKIKNFFVNKGNRTWGKLCRECSELIKEFPIFDVDFLGTQNVYFINKL